MSLHFFFFVFFLCVCSCVKFRNVEVSIILLLLHSAMATAHRPQPARRSSVKLKSDVPWPRWCLQSETKNVWNLRSCSLNRRELQLALQILSLLLCEDLGMKRSPYEFFSVPLSMATDHSQVDHQSIWRAMRWRLQFEFNIFVVTWKEDCLKLKHVPALLNEDFWLPSLCMCVCVKCSCVRSGNVKVPDVLCLTHPPWPHLTILSNSNLTCPDLTHAKLEQTARTSDNQKLDIT